MLAKKLQWFFIGAYSILDPTVSMGSIVRRIHYRRGFSADTRALRDDKRRIVAAFTRSANKVITSTTGAVNES